MYKGVTTHPRLSDIPSSAIDTFLTRHQNVQKIFRDRALTQLIKKRLRQNLSVEGEINNHIDVLGNEKAYFTIFRNSGGSDYFAILKKNKLIIYHLTTWIED